jgi:hypothetical protein
MNTWGYRIVQAIACAIATLLITDPVLAVALAADDPLFAHGAFGLVSAWHKAGKPVELHFFGQGGHGFGMARQSLTSDLWPDEFLAWMRMRGLIEK